MQAALFIAVSITACWSFGQECIRAKTVPVRSPKRVRVHVQVGSVTNTFNVPGVEENCFFLKDMEGAKALRQRINECFEISALPSTTPEERKRLLTFVVVRCHHCQLE